MSMDCLKVVRDLVHLTIAVVWQQPEMKLNLMEQHPLCFECRLKGVVILPKHFVASAMY